MDPTFPTHAFRDDSYDPNDPNKRKRPPPRHVQQLPHPKKSLFYVKPGHVDGNEHFIGEVRETDPKTNDVKYLRTCRAGHGGRCSLSGFNTASSITNLSLHEGEPSAKRRRVKHSNKENGTSPSPLLRCLLLIHPEPPMESPNTGNPSTSPLVSPFPCRSTNKIEVHPFSSRQR